MFTRIVALFTVLFFVPPTYAEEMTNDEKAVWAQEEAYYVYVVNNDIEGYLTLWDERFVGWPGDSPKPATKKNIADWIAPLHLDPAFRPEYKITRMAVRSFGDIVVVHYASTRFAVNKATGDKQIKWSGRLTHTWKRHGDTWKIITGMSSN